MTIAEMHVWFRQYAQQMGMQNVRAILPEQIDLLINTSITDTVNQLIRENIGITNDRIITDNSKLGQINALRTLYKVREIRIPPHKVSSADPKDVASAFHFSSKDKNTGKISNSDLRNYYTELSLPEYLFIVDFSINYKVATRGYVDAARDYMIIDEIPVFSENAVETNYFPVRLIDDAYLADTLNDFVLKPRLRSPIVVTYNNGIFDIYIDKFTKGSDETYKLANNLLPWTLRFSYISKPAKVQYAEDIEGQNVDCDLPESMHIDILKHAVDLYRIAVTGSLHAQQQQEQTQQQENMRNNYRNDGNQQVQ